MSALAATAVVEAEVGDPEPFGGRQFGSGEGFAEATVLAAVTPSVQEDHPIPGLVPAAEAVLIGSQRPQQVFLAAGCHPGNESIGSNPLLRIQVPGVQSDARQLDLIAADDEIEAGVGKLGFCAGGFLQDKEPRVVQDIAGEEKIAGEVLRSDIGYELPRLPQGISVVAAVEEFDARQLPMAAGQGQAFQDRGRARPVHQAVRIPDRPPHVAAGGFLPPGTGTRAAKVHVAGDGRTVLIKPDNRFTSSV